jgi:hypothetical protein
MFFKTNSNLTKFKSDLLYMTLTCTIVSMIKLRTRPISCKTFRMLTPSAHERGISEYGVMIADTIIIGTWYQRVWSHDSRYYQYRNVVSASMES